MDLSGDPFSETHFDDLLTTLHGTRPKAPALGSASSGPTASPPVPATATFKPLRITGIVVDEIGAPRYDGTRGSALYVVPFQLSHQPPAGWADLFVANWNHPPQWTTMHRPGIASVRGDKIILDGTSVEEVEQTHRDTLILALNQANKQFAELDARRRRAEEAERLRAEEHNKKVTATAKRLKFDN